MQYWYGEQLRRYRAQITRAFALFSVNNGNDANGNPTLVRVPCWYGNPTRTALALIQGNTENKVPNVPFITAYITQVKMAPDRRQDPQHVRHVQVVERKYDSQTNSYNGIPGNRYTIDEYMPVPYDLMVNVDIWSNNESIKEQILEQILVLFNPAIDIQTSVNPLDWTVLTYLEMTDIEWSSRTMPVGADNPIEVTTLRFKVPAWINPPAKVKRQSIILEIITSVIEGSKDPNAIGWETYELFSRTITTPHDANIKVLQLGGYDYQLQLCDSTGNSIDNQRLPTVITSSTNPKLFTKMQFLWNDVIITIDHIDLPTAIDDIRTSLSGTNCNCILFNDNEIQLINNNGGDNTFQNIVPGSLEALGIKDITYPGTNLAWWRLLQKYGNINTYLLYGVNASQIRLLTSSDITQTNTDIVGWIDLDPIDQNKLIWHADPQSFPKSTLPNISAIIDPQQSGPDVNLPSPAFGQRYLLTNNPAITSVAWGDMIGKADDIIEWNGNQWNPSWVSSLNENCATQYLFNSRSNRVYKWEDGGWSSIILSRYHQGYWRLVL